MSLHGGSFAEYDKRLHALARLRATQAVMRNEVDTTRQVLSELREIATSYQAFRRRVKTLQADADDGPRSGAAHPPRRQPSYGDGGVPRPESLSDIHSRYSRALDIAEDMNSYIPSLLGSLREIREADTRGAQKAQAFAADLKWLDTPLPSRCFRAYTRDCPVHGWARVKLMLLALVLVLLTLASVVAVAFAAVFVVWPFMLRCAGLAMRFWRWLKRVIFVLRTIVGDGDSGAYDGAQRGMSAQSPVMGTYAIPWYSASSADTQRRSLWKKSTSSDGLTYLEWTEDALCHEDGEEVRERVAGEGGEEKVATGLSVTLGGCGEESGRVVDVFYDFHETDEVEAFWPLREALHRRVLVRQQLRASEPGIAFRVRLGDGHVLLREVHAHVFVAVVACGLDELVANVPDAQGVHAMQHGELARRAPPLRAQTREMRDLCWVERRRRAQHGQRSGAGVLSTSFGAGGLNGLGASFLNDNPLATSVYDALDPWSAAPTPPPAARPSPFGFLDGESPTLTDRFGCRAHPPSSEATRVPAVYAKAFALVDPNSSGETSLSSLHRVVATSGLPAQTIDRIVNLVSTHTRVTRLEFYVALALVALAQSGEDISIERVASLAQQNSLPEPQLDLSVIAASAFNNAFRTAPVVTPSAYSAADDPWSAPGVIPSENNTAPTSAPVGLPSAIGTGLPKDWFRRQESVRVDVHGQLGFIFNRYTVYELQTERGGPVLRRYSEFVVLWDCLVLRYPFRILPNLPPKRIGTDEAFIEQRRKGLARFINFAVNHPVVKDDGLLAAFLTEPSFEEWRKHSPISLEEESSSKRIDRIEEMTIPSDLDDKLESVRRKLGAVIEHWQRICLLGDRLAKRREAAAADLTRLAMTLNSLNEVNGTCWRGESCDACAGVRDGLGRVSGRVQGHAHNLERRADTLFAATLETLKGQRDLYIAMRDLFSRHDRLSGDAVERLKKRVATFQDRLEGVRAAQKDGWAAEADRIAQGIEQDQAAIAAQLARRVFIRHCMWHELRVVLHNRENTLLVHALQTFGRDEREFAEVALATWSAFKEEVDSMPLDI
ncbi:hypothetical protein EXIGLDRAFT_708456 [Exidia glandulosa HHB12029]|uniref:Sorting nexin MVP1 n=1 Tax=Exidia glandulosa HHB12029 TaxID=1314781 RepID=A0A165JAA8_EXIGL|nr:hypothetical protein EXIGLDRAFT_708456 [Exidia glandulosa HHB12029]